MKLIILYRFFKGLSADYKRESVKFMWSVVEHCPDQFPRVIPFILMGVHYSKFSFEHVLPKLDKTLAELARESTRRDQSSDVPFV
jgi:hypothetical protein